MGADEVLRWVLIPRKGFVLRSRSVLFIPRQSHPQKKLHLAGQSAAIVK
jgi:hypothetical protein